MKSIFYLSSDGFPTRKNINLGIFSYEQVISEKNKKFFCIDLLTNNSSRIKINFFKKKRIYRLLNTKFNFINILKNLFFLNKLSKREKPSLIICSFLSLKNIFYALFLFKRTVQIIHGSDANVDNKIKKLFFYLYLCFFTKKIFTVSKYTKKILLKNFKNNKIKNKTRVVYNGVSFQKFKETDKNFLNKIKTKKKLILCVANLVERKNIQQLVKIFYSIEKKKPNTFHLNIVGDGPEKFKIQKMINKYKLEKKITIFKNLSNKQLSSLYRVSHFFMLFSKEFKKQFEGFGIVFLEAMYSNCVVFSSKHGGINELIKNKINGYSFNMKYKSTTNKIVRTFLKLNNNYNLKRKIINNARNFSLKFTWQKNLKKILSLSYE